MSVSLQSFWQQVMFRLDRINRVLSALSLYAIVNLDLVFYHVHQWIGLDVLPAPFDMDVNKPTFALVPIGMQWIAGLSGPAFRFLFTTSLVLANYAAPRHSALPYCLVLYIPFFTVYSAACGSFWSLLFLVFGIIPLIELMVDKDRVNPTKEEEVALNKQTSFILVTVMWVPLQVLLVTWACWATTVYALSPWEYLGLAVGVGCNGGILGINVAHELIHKAGSRMEQALGRVLLVMVCYGHWAVEHLQGHHRRVATKEDPATCAYGEDFYHFLPRTVLEGARSGWHLEADRMSLLGKPVWSWWHNEVIRLTAMSALLGAVYTIAWGLRAGGLFVMQAAVAIALLELTNYIEHYGLARKQTPHGYEQVSVHHSWNADSPITNIFLFKLQRHSDHHANALRRYQVLRSFETSPQMPTGYAGMILLALFPPLWFRVMNPRVLRYNQQLKTSSS